MPRAAPSPPTRAAHRFLAAVVLAGLGFSSPTLAGDDAAAPDGVEVTGPDDLSSEERAAAGTALASVVWLAAAPEESTPPANAADATAFVVGDGLALTTERYLARVAAMPGGGRLFARTPGGAWVRAVAVARSAWTDVGVIRLVGGGPSRPMRFGASPKGPTGRLVTVGPATRAGKAEIRVGPLSAVGWFDPGADGGRSECRRGGPDRRPAAGGFALSLRLGEGLAGRGVEGSPLLDPTGACVGMALGVDADRPAIEAVRACPVDLLRAVLGQARVEGRIEGLDLGVRLEPAPTPGGGAARLPAEVARLRASTKEKGGAMVGNVSQDGPAFGLLWPGDVVLEIEGHPIFCDVPESLAYATLALREGVPADVIVWRGKREHVAVTPRRPTRPR